MASAKDKYLQADKDMPPLHRDDDATLNLRENFLKARERGYARPHHAVITQIQTEGYDRTLLSQVIKGMGQGNFPTLFMSGDYDLTSEYLVWKHLMRRLPAELHTPLNALAKQSGFK